MTAWHHAHWSSLGLRVLGRPAVVEGGRDLELVVIALGTLRLLHLARSAPNGPWREVVPSGEPVPARAVDDGPAAARDAVGRIAVLVDDGWGVVWQGRGGIEGHDWSPWRDLADPDGPDKTGRPAVFRRSDGRLEVLARAADARVWRTAERVGGLGFATWKRLGSGGAFEGTPVIATDAAGLPHAFIAGTDGGLWHAATDPADATWHEWQPLGGDVAGTPTAARVGDRLVVVAAAADHTLAALALDAAHEPAPTWQPLGGQAVDPAAVTGADGRIELFARGLGGALVHRRESSPGAWDPWTTPPAPPLAVPPVAALAPDGCIDLFVRAPDGILWHARQSRPGAWPW